MVNSKFSKQWLCERYAVKALRVQGGGAEFERTSGKVGRCGWYVECVCIVSSSTVTLSGGEGLTSSIDIVSSSSASQSDIVRDDLDEDSGDGVRR